MKPRHSTARRFRPLLDVLEDRSLPSTGLTPVERYDLNQQFAFYKPGDYVQNWSGLYNEKWIRAANDGYRWHYIMPDGRLYRWTGDFAKDVLIDNVGSLLWNDPALLHDAPPPAGPSASLYTLDQQYGFYFTGDYFKNWSNSLNEKWFLADKENDAWFYMRPDGKVFRWQGTFPSSVQVAVVDAAVYANPALLTNAQPPSGKLFELDQQFAFYFPASYAENTGGFNEKWIRSGNDFNRLYYILPNGDLFRWTGSFATSVFISGVGTLAWSNPARLHDAAPAAGPSQTLYDLDKQHRFSFSGDYALNWDGRNEKWILSATAGWFYILPNGDLYRWSTTSIADTFITNVGVSAWKDPGLLHDAQPTDAKLTALETQYDFFFVTHYSQNLSGFLNEKWVRAAKDGNRLYYIQPTGELYLWSGNFGASTLIANLGTRVWNSPAYLHDA